MIYQLHQIEQIVLGVRGIARDLAAAGAGNLINQKEKKLDKKNKQTIKV